MDVWIVKHVLVVIGAALYNRGSEAVARGIAQILKKAYPECILALSSSEESFPNGVSYEGYDKYVNRYDKEFFEKFFDLTPEEFEKSTETKKFVEYAKDMDLIVYVGADNLDKSYKIAGRRLIGIKSLLQKYSNAKTLLYNCSLAERDLDEDILNFIAGFDAVTIRESISESNLLKANKDISYKFFPDPAFVMPPETVDLPKNFLVGKTVGLNLSELIMRPIYGGADRDSIIAIYSKLVNHIFNETDYSVLLLPHVMQGADLTALKDIAAYTTSNYGSSERLIVLDNEELSAPQLKYIISKCRLYIGARTHSTIASYSSCVPTLTIGYSVKSLGIAKDLFGDHDKYVIPIDELKDESTLLKRFCWLDQNQNKIRDHLLETMPLYKEQVWGMSEFIKEL